MMRKYVICAFVLLTVSIIHETNGISPVKQKSIEYTRSIIIAAIKKEIKKLISLVEGIVHNAVDELIEIEHNIANITEGAIKLALDAINQVIDGAIDSVRKIAEDAIDAGINITECYVKSLDDLNAIRRRLLADEVLCATSELDQFNDIINAATNNFIGDLNVILQLPARLKDCLTSLNMISCETDLVTDIMHMQQEIPKQIIGTMLSITEYMADFDKRVHKCQFDELREAIDESRKVVDGLRYCATEDENTTGGRSRYTF